MPDNPLPVHHSRFAVWSPTGRSRSMELGRLPVASGHLAIRDVYDVERPQVVLAVPAGELRVWSTELDVQPKERAAEGVFRPAYLSVQLSDADPVYVGLPDTLHHMDIPPFGVSIYTDLGLILLHDADAITAADMESLDQQWEQAWESPQD